MNKQVDSFQQRLHGILSDYTRLAELQNIFQLDRPSLMEHSTIWAWECDPNGNLTWCSPEVTHLTGFEPSDLAGEPVFASILTGASKSVLQTALQGKRTIRNLVLEGITRDGKTIHIAFHAEPGKPDSSGTSGSHGLASMIQTEIPKDGHPPGTSSDTGLASQVDQVMPLYRSTGGFTLSREGYNSTAVPLAEAPQKPEIRGTVLRVPVQSGGSVLGVLELDRGETGKTWTLEDLAVVENLAGQLGSAVQDIRAYELTLQALEEMQQADQLKSQLLANMSHELRTPLNSIIGFSSVILKGIDGPINETQEQDVQQIYNAGQHLLGLINNVLDLSKIEADKMELTLNRVDLASVIQEVVEITNALIKQKPVELVVDIQQGIPVIEADSTRVRQILLNLLSNAVKFTNEGHIAIYARTYAGKQGEEIVIAVADTGIGIAPVDQIKLFEPFSQIQGMSSRPGSGTGLGLSICRHLVELHRGRIWVESSPGVGSTFIFTLPVSQAATFLQEPAASLCLLSENENTITQLVELLPKYKLLPGDLEQVVRGRAGSQVTPPLLAEIPESDQELWHMLDQLVHSPLQGYPVQFLSFQNKEGVLLPPLRLLPLPVPEAAINNLQDSIDGAGAGEANPVWFIVDSDSARAGSLAARFSAAGRIDAREFSDARTALAEIRADRPSTLFFNLFMPQAEGFRILETLRTEQLLAAGDCYLMLPEKPAGHEGRQFMRYIQHLVKNNSLSLPVIRKQIDESIASFSSS